MISENQFLICHLSPKLFNHLGINEIYQDPRQNFSLNISHNAIPRPLINIVTLQFLPIMDFMIGLPSTSSRPDSIWIIIDNQHLFFNYTLFTLPRSVLVFILITLFYTYHQRQLFPILVLNSQHAFWETNCNLLCVNAAESKTSLSSFNQR